MKKIIFILILAMVTLSSADASSFKHKRYYNNVTISFQRFYDELAPFGDWIYSPDYGYIWRPYFDYPQAFRPYSSGGHWVYTQYGWTWISDYPWGWATFHYGRWDYDDYLGWVWIPGYEWAPAWVSWGQYNDYWGWAPLGPRISVSINFNWMAPSAWWTFVPYRHFCSDRWNNYIYDRPVYVTNITKITNIYNVNNNSSDRGGWFNGPRVSDVERMGSTRVKSMNVADADRPSRTSISGNTVEIFRPGIDNSRSDARPAEFRNIANVRTGSRMEAQSPRTNNPGEFRTRESVTPQRAASSNTVIRRTDEPGSVLPARETNTGTVRGNDNSMENRGGREIPDRAKPQGTVIENRTTSAPSNIETRVNTVPRSETPARVNVEDRRNQGAVNREQAPAPRREAPVNVERQTRSESNAPAVRTQPELREQPVQLQRSEPQRQSPAPRSEERKAENSREKKSERTTSVERPSR